MTGPVLIKTEWRLPDKYMHADDPDGGYMIMEFQMGLVNHMTKKQRKEGIVIYEGPFAGETMISLKQASGYAPIARGIVNATIALTLVEALMMYRPLYCHELLDGLNKEGQDNG